MMWPFRKSSKKWYKVAHSNFVQVESPLTLNDINKILLIEGIDRMQFFLSKDLSPQVFDETWKLLNQHYYTKRPNVGLRVYGHIHGLWTNLSFLTYLSNLRRFAVSEWLLEDLSPISCLEKLEYLVIGETKSSRLSYSPLRSLTKLKTLYINGTKKDMEAISSLKQLKKLNLRSVVLDSLDILLPLKELEELHIILGGTRNFDLLPKIGKISLLEICWIRELYETNLSPIAAMPYLQELWLRDLRHIKDFRWLKHAKKLEVLLLDSLKGLESLDGVQDLISLKALRMSATRTKDRNVEPILQCTKLQQIGIPLMWGRENILRVHEKHPHLHVRENMIKTEGAIQKLKLSRKK